MWETPLGVGRLFLVWEISIGVGHQIVEWEITLGVGRLLLVWGTFRGLPARFYRRIEPGTPTHSGYRPPAGPFSRNVWSGASFSADDSPGTRRASNEWSPSATLQREQGATSTHFRACTCPPSHPALFSKIDGVGRIALWTSVWEHCPGADFGVGILLESRSGVGILPRAGGGPCRRMSERGATPTDMRGRTFTSFAPGCLLPGRRCPCCG